MAWHRRPNKVYLNIVQSNFENSRKFVSDQMTTCAFLQQNKITVALYALCDQLTLDNLDWLAIWRGTDFGVLLAAAKRVPLGT